MTKAHAYETDSRHSFVILTITYGSTIGEKFFDILIANCFGTTLHLTAFLELFTFLVNPHYQL